MSTILGIVLGVLVAAALLAIIIYGALKMIGSVSAATSTGTPGSAVGSPPTPPTTPGSTPSTSGATLFQWTKSVPWWAWILVVVVVLVVVSMSSVRADALHPGALRVLAPWLLLPLVAYEVWYHSYEPSGPIGATGYKDSKRTINVVLLTALAILLFQTREVAVVVVRALGIGLGGIFLPLLEVMWINYLMTGMGAILFFGAVWYGFMEGRYRKAAVFVNFLIIFWIFAHA